MPHLAPIAPTGIFAAHCGGEAQQFFLLLLGGYSSQAQTIPPAPFNSLTYNNVNCQLSGSSLNGSGAALYQFTADYSQGAATLTWNVVNDTFVSLACSDAYGHSASYVDAADSSHPGALRNIGSSAVDFNLLTSLSGRDNWSVYNSDLAVPPPADSCFISTFTYGGHVYTFTQATCALFRDICHFTADDSVGAATIEMKMGSSSVLRWEIHPAGTLPVATYLDGLAQGQGGYFVLQGGANAPNTLTSINSVPTVISGSLVGYPLPHSFTYGGAVFQATKINWIPGNSYLGTATTPALEYVTDTGGAARSTLTSELDLAISATSATQSLYTIYRSLSGASVGGLVGVFSFYSYTGSANNLTMLDGVPYSAEGNYAVPTADAVPDPPVNSFDYDGHSYQLNGPGYKVSDGNAVYNFHDDNGDGAILRWNPFTSRVAQWDINLAGGANARYVDGAASGHPGSYVFQGADPSGNLLTLVNGKTFAANGNLSAPTATDLTAAGNLTVHGNFLNLGSWDQDATRSGLYLSYYDAVNTPSSVNFVSSRSANDWVWGHASADGSYSVLSMLHDPRHRLMLYPAPTSSSTATAPAASIVLNPNVGGTSRFDGPVRISRQGDLSMGEFTVEPAAAY